MFAAARQRGARAIGVDSDQFDARAVLRGDEHGQAGRCRGGRCRQGCHREAVPGRAARARARGAWRDVRRRRAQRGAVAARGRAARAGDRRRDRRRQDPGAVDSDSRATLTQARTARARCSSGATLAVARGHGARAGRRERRGQVDAGQDPRRHRAARTAGRSTSTARRSTLARWDRVAARARRDRHRAAARRIGGDAERRRERGARRRGRAVLDLAPTAAALAKLGDAIGLPVDPWARAEDLPLGAAQRAEIVAALHQGAKLLILDEPTAVLAPVEVDGLLATLRTARGARARRSCWSPTSSTRCARSPTR